MASVPVYSLSGELLANVLVCDVWWQMEGGICLQWAVGLASSKRYTECQEGDKVASFYKQLPIPSVRLVPRG